MEKQPDRLDTLAALCERKLLADPNHPRAQRLKCDLARYAKAKKLGEKEKEHGSTTPPSAGNRSASQPYE